MISTRHLDPRIGVLNSGRYYAYVNGHQNEPVMGTLAEVSQALGLILAPAAARRGKGELLTYNVKMTFQHPAWDEVAGIDYEGIVASSKSEANKKARRLAERDGHVYGRGRIFFKATEVE